MLGIPRIATALTILAIDSVLGAPGFVLAQGSVAAEPATTFWSFQPLSRPKIPAVADTGFVRTPVDAFLLARLEAAGLSPAPPATKTTQLRRAYYSLTGLPPTIEEVRAFLDDDSPDAWEKVIDRLLASPQYGERWARHWLDLVRYAETNGYEFDRPKPEVWRYRDYVIRVFNDDKPYDRFILEQLAGDELEPVTADGMIATGFYKLGPVDGGAPDRLQAEFDELDDILTTTGQVFLGLTVNCARCHDHKVDPIPTADYYRMLAFFRGIERGRRGASTRPIQLVAGGGDQQEVGRWERKYAPVARRIQAIEMALWPKLEGGEADDFREESYRPAIVRAHSPKHVSPETLARYEKLLIERRELDEAKPDGLARALCVMERGPRPKATHILIRGSPYAPGEEVEPGFPTALSTVRPHVPTPSSGAASCGRRLVLAQWIASPENPLTARVMANRIWHYHFNRGIVRSTNDFGLGGTPPTHPELLDWLASELVDGGWRLKRLHKLILMSSAYRMSSQASDEALAADVENDLLSRFELRRLEAEEIRDSILAVSGNLNLKMHGPSIYPKLADEVLAGQSRPGEGWHTSPPEEQVRRSVYIHIKRSLAVPLLAVFDAADPDSTCPVRFSTTQPTQALTMLNSADLQEQAAVFAQDLLERVGGDLSAQVASALARVTQRVPTPAEIDRGVEFLVRLQQDHNLSDETALERFCLMALNLNEFVYLD